MRAGAVLLLAGLALVIAGTGWLLLRGKPQLNVLLITIDTLRADHLSLDGYPRATSPALDSLADSSVVFEDCVASSTWTLPTLASVMTSASPPSHRCRNFHDVLAPEFETLPEILAGIGYRTAAVLTHTWLKPKYGLTQGVTEVDDELIRASEELQFESVSSPQVTDRAIAWLRSHLASDAAGKPFFLWTHYFDPHFTYLSHVQDGIDFGGTEIDRYDGEIAFTDRHLERLLGELEKLELMDRTIIVVLGDHGEEFEEHGGEHPHGSNLHQETNRVPWLMRVPGIPPHRVKQLVRQVDLAPTLLDLLEAPLPRHAEGRSLRPLLEGLPLPPEDAYADVSVFAREKWRGVITPEWKLVFGPSNDLDRPGPARLYHRPSDPEEMHDQAADHPEVVHRLSERLDELRMRSVAGRPTPAPPVRLTPSPEEEEALRAIGYE